MATRTVLVADDHPLFRDALAIAIDRAAPGARVIEAGGLAEALAAARREAAIDLVLLDLMMPDSHGFAGLAALKAELPLTPIVVVSAAEAGAAAAKARDYGAAGFLHKGADLSVIEDAVGRALSGDEAPLWGPESDPGRAPRGDFDSRVASLTPAQVKVLMGLLEGRLNKQIAYEMSISEATVKAHMTAVFRKLNVRNRTQAVLAAKALSVRADAPV